MSHAHVKCDALYYTVYKELKTATGNNQRCSGVMKLRYYDNVIVEQLATKCFVPLHWLINKLID